MCCGDDKKSKKAGLIDDDDRGCTDIICLLIFVVFLGGMGAVAYIAVTCGAPWRIVKGYDSFGNTCGVNNVRPEGITAQHSGKNLTEFPYLMYFDPTVMIPSSLITIPYLDNSSDSKDTSMMVCVKSCPDFNVFDPLNGESGVKNLLMSQYKSQFENSSYSVCEYDFLENMTDSELSNIKLATGTDYDKQYISKEGSSGPCPKFVFKSYPILNRCVPWVELNNETVNIFVDKIEDLLDAVSFGNTSVTQYLQHGINDIMNSGSELCIMSGASLIISFVIILLLGYIAEIMVYVIAIATSVLCIACPTYFWLVWYQAKETLSSQTVVLDAEIQNVDTLMIYAIVASVVCLVVLLIVIFLRSRILLMLGLFKEAGKQALLMFSILFTPILLALFIMAWAALWCFVSSFIYTSGTPTELTFTRPYTDSVSEADANITMVFFKSHDYIPYVWLYHLFGLYWGVEFLLACHEMAIAGAFVHQYWKHSTSFPVLRGIWLVLRYHIGTVAFGSCILAIIVLIRSILAYIQNKVKDSESRIAKFVLCCVQCCLGCVQRLVSFLNQNTYIYTAMKGTNFCVSSAAVMKLLVTQCARICVINCVGSFILFLGKFLVVMVTACLGYYLMNADDALYFWSIPVLLGSIFAFIVAQVFFSVFELGIDTLFICFVEEEENKGDGDAYKNDALAQWMQGYKAPGGCCACLCPADEGEGYKKVEGVAEAKV